MAHRAVRSRSGGHAAALPREGRNAIIDSMAQLIVRNIDAVTVRALKMRAARNGRSAEAEHREILRAALRDHDGRSLKDHLLAMPSAGDDADFQRSASRARRVDG